MTRRPALDDVTHLVTLDPGTRHLGVAAYEVDGWDATDPGVRTWSLVSAVDIETHHASVDAAVDALRRTVAYAWAGPDAVLVSEYPTLYTKRRVTHGTVRELRLVVEAVEAAGAWSACNRVAPRTWKGNCPKPIHHGRILRAMTEQEREAWWDCLGPDARDAIGLGLWSVGRM